jgi:hypothetical protein
VIFAVVVSCTLTKCLFDRSALSGDEADAGALDAPGSDAPRPDAALPDAPGLDAPFDDAAPLDAFVMPEDVFFVMPDTGPPPPTSEAVMRGRVDRRWAPRHATRATTTATATWTRASAEAASRA